MSEITRSAATGALEAVYQRITAVADRLGEAELMLPSRCAGWAVADVLFHQLLDARRALRAFASPSAGPPDVDDISYWRDYPAGNGQAEQAPAAAHARYVRISASA
jgi:hypothetical protein